MFQKFMMVAAWSTLVFIAYATLAPIHDRPLLIAHPTSLSVLIERVGAYGLLGLLFGLAYPRRLAMIFIVVLGSAVTLELFQLLIADRDARLVDVVEKLAGGVMGIAAALMLQRLSERTS